MKIIDEVNISMQMQNARMAITGQQVTGCNTKPVEIDLVFRIREDITPEQLVDLMNEFEERGEEISHAFEAVEAFLERVLPIDELEKL